MRRNRSSVMLRSITLFLLLACALVAVPTDAQGQCCDPEIMCHCDGIQQCCDHESLNALACSATEEDYCRDVCPLPGDSD
jgi:hypothetical protein